MDITRSIRKGRRVGGLVIVVVAVLGLALSSSMRTSTITADYDDELEGIVGPDLVLVNPPSAIEASFTNESYRPGDTAILRLFGDVDRLTIRLFRSGPERIVTRRKDMMFGVEVANRVTVPSGHRGQELSLRIGNWPSGVYFARLSSGTARIGFAPFVVAPRRLGEHRIAVVMPTNTWLAYNVRDDDRDGVGDSWYADPEHLSVGIARPFLSRGVPFRFKSYDLPFLRWLDRRGKQVDVLSDRDLDGVTAEELADAYRLIVFPGHHEYVTENEFDAIEGYRDLGGNLVFLSANNFFWQVKREDGRLRRVQKWRELGRPEASVIGVQYIGNDEGEARGPWLVKRSRHSGWLFAGTGTEPGGRLTNGGIEIDAIDRSSPHGTAVVAEIPNLFGTGMTAQMTYYETPRGAHVFAAGAFTLAGAAFQPDVNALLENIWQALTRGRMS